MSAFPSNIKPSVTQGYGYGAPDNIISQQVMGGSPLHMLDYATGPISFNVGLILSNQQLKDWQLFYFDEINSGADEFTMNLNSGNGVEEHTVAIINGSLRIDGSRQPIWICNFNVIAKTTPFQANPYNGDLCDLYEIYGDDLPKLLNQLEIFALEDLPK